MIEKKLADTPLALWLAKAMRDWRNPETGVWGMSQNELARQAGISQSQLSQILKEANVPRHTTLNQLAAVFDVHPFVLYELAYLPPEHESLEPKIRSRLQALVRQISEWPPAVQEEFLARMAQQAEMHEIAHNQWEKEPA